MYGPIKEEVSVSYQTYHLTIVFHSIQSLEVILKHVKSCHTLTVEFNSAQLPNVNALMKALRGYPARSHTISLDTIDHSNFQQLRKLKRVSIRARNTLLGHLATHLTLTGDDPIY